MIFKDGKTFSAYVRSKLHSGYITLIDLADLLNELWWAGWLQFTYFSMITYISECFVCKLVYFIELSVY